MNHIYKHASDKSKKSLSVGNSRILSVVDCDLAPAYISLCKGLKYLPIDRYIILIDPLFYKMDF